MREGLVGLGEVSAPDQRVAASKLAVELDSFVSDSQIIEPIEKRLRAVDVAGDGFGPREPRHRLGPHLLARIAGCVEQLEAAHVRDPRLVRVTERAPQPLTAPDPGVGLSRGIGAREGGCRPLERRERLLSSAAPRLHLGELLEQLCVVGRDPNCLLKESGGLPIGRHRAGVSRRAHEVLDSGFLAAGEQQVPSCLGSLARRSFSREDHGEARVQLRPLRFSEIRIDGLAQEGVPVGEMPGS